MSKRAKEEPSVLGLLLLVGGMLLLSIAAMYFLGRSAAETNGLLVIVLACAGFIALGIGAVLSGRKRKPK